MNRVDHSVRMLKRLCAMKFSSSLFALSMLLVLGVSSAKAAAPDLLGKTGWTAVMYGAAKDPQGDSQAGAADTDIIADATHGSLYVGFNDNGTVTTADDGIYFRLRIDNPTSSSPAVFGGVAVVGIDANLDGRIDLFLMVDGRNSGQVVRLMDPGTGSNISPNTTSTSPLPTGWLPNNGVYSFTTALYSAVAVSATTDPHWSTPNGDDLSGQGGKDIFVSWRIPMSDLATVLAIPSPVDRNGTYGPRGATGITGYTKDTLAQYVAFTQTQAGPINGDLNGVGASYDKNATFASLGTFTAPMSAANPVSASDAVTITQPVDVNSLINATEDNALVIHGTATPTNSWVRLTISDTNGITPDIVVWVQANGVGPSTNVSAWTITTNISALADGPLTFTAALVTANLSNTLVANSSGDTATATHDTVAPSISVTPVTTTGRPVISGTSTDVPAGSIITVSIDPNGDGVLTDLITYSAVVDASGNWSVNTAVVSPTSGTMPSGGLTAYATITATGQDAAGNSFSTTGVTRPTVNAITTNDTTPVITGNWGGSNGGTDVLSVVVNGVTYTQGDGNLVVTGNTWTLTIPPGNALTTGGSPYNVTTTVTRSGTPYSNVTSGSVVIVTGPTVIITSASSQATTKPTISGTSTINSGTISLRIDPNNDGSFGDAIYYTVPTNGSGAWSLNTSTNAPLSGTYPLAGITGAMGILVTATDSNGVTITATQTLTVSIPTISITTITSTVVSNATGTVTNSDFVINKREDDAITVSGTSTNAVGQMVTVTVSDSDSGTLDPSGTATVAGDGSWSVTGLNLSALRDGYITFTATVSTATASNNLYTHDGSVPLIRLNTPTPLDKNVASTIYGASDLVAGSTISVAITPAGQSTQTVTATVDTNGNWSATFTSFTGNPASASIVATPDINATDKSGNRPAAALTQVVTVNNGATFLSPILGPIQIGTIAGDNIITTAEASSVVISGTSSQGSGTVTITVTNFSGTQLFSTTATIATNSGAGTNIWSTSGLNFSSSTPNGPLVVTATLTVTGSPTITYVDVAMPTLQLGTVGTGGAPDIAINTVGDSNISASETNAVTIAGTTLNVLSGTNVVITVTDGSISRTNTATVTASGTWTNSAVSFFGLADGNITVTAVVTSNSQSATNTVTVKKDTVVDGLAITSGPSSGDSTPIISGTSGLPTGTVLTIGIDLDNDGIIDLTYTTTVQAGGSWSVDTGTATPSTGTFPPSGIPANSTVTVSGTDSAGNVSSISSTSITSISSDNGVSSTDFITSDPTLQFFGRAATNQTVSLLLTNISGTIIFNTTVTANSSGNWSFNYGSSLASSNYTLVASVTTGSVSATATQAITIDTVAPTAATVAISGDSGTSGSDFITSDNTLLFSGTADPNGSVLVTLKNSSNVTVFSTAVTASGGGAWSVDRTGSTLPDGTYTLTVVTTDNAGNTNTTIQTIIIDTSAAITLTTNATTSDTTPLISGTSDLEVGRIITVMIDANNNGLYDDGPSYTYTATVQTGGTWSVEATNGVSVGTVNLQATGTDAAGNSATATKILTVDTNAPTLTITEPIGDGNLNATEDNVVLIHGTSTFVPNGSILSVSITDGTTTILDSATVAPGGSWTLAPINLSSLANGVITVTVNYVDNSGASFSDTATVLHNKSGSTTIDSIGTDTGILSDFITYDTTLIFTGSASPNDIVTLTLTNNAGATVFTTNVTANASGVWTFDYRGTVLTNDTYTLKADNGVVGMQSFTVDTIAPSGPVAVAPQTTSDTTPTITGTVTLGTGETLTVTLNGVTYTVGDGNLTVDGSGNWSLTVPPANELTAAVGGGFNGNYTVTATVTDTAGNTLSSSSTVTVSAAGTATLTAASGGGALSADDSASATFTTLSGPSYIEGAGGNVSVGTIILKAPTGFVFDTGGVAPTVLVTGSATAGNNVNDAPTGSSLAVSSVTSSKITFTVTAASTVANSLAWQNIRVRPSAGTPLATGNLTMDATSTATVTSVTAGTTSFGALTEVHGALSAYTVTAATSPVASGTGDQLTIKLVDQFGNILTDFTGDVALTFSGLGTSAGGNVPTVTDKNGNTVNLGSPTTISFTNGVSTLGGLLKAYKAETASLQATDGTHSTSTTGGSGVSVTVNGGTASAYRLTAATSTPTAGQSDILTIKQVDQYGNTVTTFSGDLSLTFSGLGNSTSGSVPTVTDKNGTAINLGSPATITFTSGVATVGGTLVAYKTETATLNVTDGSLSSGSTGGTGVALTISAATANAYRITATTATPSVGSADALTIKQVDLYGNTVTTLNGDVALTFSGLANATTGTVPTVTDKTGSAVNLGTATTITFTSGISTAGGSLLAYKAETATLHATDGSARSTSSPGGAGAALTVGSGVASSYRISVATGTPNAGSADLLTIKLVDQYGNPVTSFNGDVALTFSGLGTSTGGNVPTVTDKNGNPVPEGTPTFITFTGGVATVGGSLVAYKAETTTLDVTDGTYLSSGPGGSGAALTVSAGVANAYRISAASATPVAGSADALTLTQVDAYGNTVTGFSGDAVLTFSGLGNAITGTVPTVTDKTGTAINLGTTTTITFSSGVSTVGGSLKAYKAETATLNVNDGTLFSSGTGGTGATLTVTSNTFSGYRITAASSTPTAGTADALTIRRVDTYGNVVTTFSGDVALTFTGLAASPLGTVPTVTDKTGSAKNLGSATTITFTGGVGTAGGSLIAYKAQTATLLATDGTYSTSTAGGSGATLTVAAGTASKLVFTTQPAKVEINTPFQQQPVVKTQDAYGNLSTTGLASSLTVTITLTSGTGTLTGTAALDIGTGAGNGTVTFTDLQLDTAGAGNQLTAAASGFTSGLSSLFEVWTIYMTSGDVIVADRGPYFSTGTILISRVASPATAVIITSVKDPYEVAREADGNIVVVDYETTRGGGLFRINRLTFDVTRVSSGGDFKVPFGVKVETKAPNAGQILVADLDAFSEAGAVFRVDPVTGVQTTLTQGDNFYFLQGLAIAPTGTPNDGDIYVTSVGDGAAITSKLIKIDPTTGTQTVISAADNFNYPVGMVVESNGNILVVDAKAKKIIRVDPSTGTQTVLSDAANGAQGTPFLLPTHVALDSAGDLYVSDAKVNAGTNERLLFKVNKTTGNRVLITQDGFFEQPRGLLLVP